MKKAVELNEKSKNIINSIGNIVTSAMKDSKDEVETLRLLCSVHYTDTYIIPSSQLIDIAKSNECSSDKVIYVKKIVQLIKTN